MENIIVQVIDRQNIAKNSIGLTLKPKTGTFPKWTAGAHIDIILPNDQIRQYSIVNRYNSADNFLVLGLLVEKDGRGGSTWIDNNAVIGSELTLGYPRNHFEYKHENEKHNIFIAGGIGITPIRSMLEEAKINNDSWELHYIGKTLDHMPYTDQLKTYGDKVKLYPRNTTERPDFSKIATGNKNINVYCCGPETLMTAIEEWGKNRSNVQVYTERFSPKDASTDAGYDEFEVFFAYSDITAKVNAGETILEVAEAAGIYVPNSCTEGICGSCETPILKGTVVHRDSVLSEEERQASETMMICTSRATCSRLELDL